MNSVVLVRIYAFLALVLLIQGGWGLARHIPALGQPFGGFIWHWDNTYGHQVSYNTPRHWPGPQAGMIPSATIILSINGRPAGEYEDVYANTPVGSLVTYEIRSRTGQIHLVSVPVLRYTPGYLIDAYLLIFLIGISLLVCGYLLVRSANDMGRALIGWLMLAAANSAFFNGHSGSIHANYDAWFWVALVWSPSLPLMGAMLGHFALVYPHRRPLVDRWRWFIPAGYVVALLLSSVRVIQFLVHHIPGLLPLATWLNLWWLEIPVQYASTGFLAMGGLATLVSGVLAFRQRQQYTRTERQQIMIVAVAWGLWLVTLMGTVGAAVLYVPSRLEIFTTMGILLPIGMVYAFKNADLIAELEERNALQASLLEELHRVYRLQEDVRDEVAEGLHNGVLGDSKALEMELYCLYQQSQGAQLPHARLRSELERLHRQSLSVMHSLRRVVDDTKPVDFQRESLGDAIARLIRHMNTSSSKIRYEFGTHGYIDAIPVAVKAELYEIIRAALNNVREHAQATHCSVCIEQHADQVLLTIDDDGCGIEAAMSRGTIPRSARRLGLVSMQARVTRLGGQLTIQSQSPGTRVQVTLQLVRPEMLYESVYR